jgi:glycosyltransferase involved in cell wall biosynthesis
MGARGRKAVIEKYNWDVEAKKLLSIYKKILEC